VNFTSATSDGFTHVVTASSFTFAGKGDLVAFSFTSRSCSSESWLLNISDLSYLLGIRPRRELARSERVWIYESGDRQDTFRSEGAAETWL
jgi:hypothetical protein